MAAIHAPFNTRLRKIVRNHQRMNQGVSHKVTKDGLIVARPRAYNPKFPLRGILLTISAALLFKGYILSNIGAGAYSTRVEQLAQGSMIEQAGAWVMQADPLTQALAQLFTSIGL